MNLYITAAGRYVGTQAEARQDGKGWTPETVPTDKDGLIAYLNRLTAMPRALNAQAETNQRVASRSVLEDLTWKEADPSAPQPTLREAVVLTQAKVDEMFTPRPVAKLTDIAGTTDFIRGLDGFALGQIIGAALDRAAELKEQHEEIFA
jgi:hypothetical protein